MLSPDGQRIAVLQDANLDATEPKVSLAVLNVDGTGLRVVAAAKAGEIAANVQVGWHRLRRPGRALTRRESARDDVGR